MVSVFLPLLHCVIRHNGSQMSLIVFFLGLSMFLCINPVGASTPRLCVCVCILTSVLERNSWGLQTSYQNNEVVLAAAVSLQSVFGFKNDRSGCDEWKIYM